VASLRWLHFYMAISTAASTQLTSSQLTRSGREKKGTGTLRLIQTFRKESETDTLPAILPQTIILESGVTACIEKLMWVSGNPVVPTFPFMLFSKKIADKITIADWLYRLSTVVCCPCDLLTLTLMPEAGSAYLMFNVSAEWTREFRLNCDGGGHHMGLCELCKSRIPPDEEIILREGNYGTQTWAIANNNLDITEHVAWSGDNHFCRACYVLKAYVAWSLPTDNALRLTMTHGNTALIRWLEALDAALDAQMTVWSEADRSRDAERAMLERQWNKRLWNADNDAVEH
jgi:hypothetical protein